MLLLLQERAVMAMASSPVNRRIREESEMEDPATLLLLLLLIKEKR